MPMPLDALWTAIENELRLLFAAHRAVRLEGSMRLYTETDQERWRSKQGGLEKFFGEAEIPEAVDFIRQHYNDGNLPNSPCLLDPIIHKAQEDGSYEKLGSGIYWATGFALGIARMDATQYERPRDLGVLVSHFHRGDNKQAGVKMVGFADKILPPLENGIVSGCRALYDLANVQSEDYWNYYLLSGLQYLCTHGLFDHPGVGTMLKKDEIGAGDAVLVKKYRVPIQKTLDCALCFNAYDRQHRLYIHFGQDPANIPHNNRFYDLCARDLHLFDRTGPLRTNAQETFEFIVPGLIPRGAVTLLAAAGGTGKSSVAHQLCVQASIDWKPGEPQPMWLGQPVNTKVTTGICCYFSGEDGPAIINARTELFDPEGRALRLQFHRTEFQDMDLTFKEYLDSLHKMPDVSICVIDPARKFLRGNEDDSDSVSEFFEAIEEFAIRKQCAMIVVHHLQKGAHPTSAREVLDELRGSQVFIDRPRAVIGMYRDGLNTVVGLAKTNIPPNLGMILDERVFARNPKNLQLIWLPGEEGVKRDTLSPDAIEKLEFEAFQRDVEAMKKLAAEQEAAGTA